VLTEGILEVTLHRRRFMLLMGLALGLAAPWAGHQLGLYNMTRAGFPEAASAASWKVLDDLNVSQTFSAYINRSKSAFLRAKSELSDWAPSDLKLLFQLQEVMDFTKETKPSSDASKRPGAALRKSGLRAKHPVVLVPGIVTTGLELWHGEECANGYFRQRMWGTMTMVQIIMLNTRCWLKHMSLCPDTGQDLPGIKVRAACICIHVYNAYMRLCVNTHTTRARTHTDTHTHTHSHVCVCMYVYKGPRSTRL